MKLARDRILLGLESSSIKEVKHMNNISNDMQLHPTSEETFKFPQADEITLWKDPLPKREHERSGYHKDAPNTTRYVVGCRSPLKRASLDLDHHSVIKHR